ncbi:SAM-dependent methyltransferase [Streptosporangiaceae bacterium NEAU-GS5]|nr:SAM-dependent methyltransferase [Streptosporangiaceae bacterium NEAU-GS5]
MSSPSFSPENESFEIDTTVAHPARVYDYWLGGRTNFAADREAAQMAVAAHPDIIPAVRANRAFLGRTVTYLAAQAGVRQFLDVGTGIPTENNTHEVAQRIAPQSRIVYADNDPIVLAHARTLLKSDPDGATSYVFGDLREPDKILGEAEAILDLSRPVAFMLVAILQYVPGEEPYDIVERLMARAAPGSHLVISHPASDINADEVAESMKRYNERAVSLATPRTHAEVSRFFDDLDLLEPGVVSLPRWRPDSDTADVQDLPMWCGVGRKR